MSDAPGALHKALTLGVGQREAGIEVFIAVRAVVRCPLIQPLNLPAGIAATRTAALMDPRNGIGADLSHEPEYTMGHGRFKRRVHERDAPAA